MSDLQNINSTLQLIAQQLGNQSKIQSNSTPPATASSSPISYPFNNIGATGTTVVAANTGRFGLIFHNPGVVSVYVYPNSVSPAPTTTSVGGSFLIYPGSTLAFPSSLFANVNGAWSAFSIVGSNQPFTVVEFL